MQNQINTDHFSAIIFDLGGVILNLDYNLTINAFKKLGGSNFEQLYSQAQQDKIFDQYETGKISSQQFIDYLRQFLPSNTSDQTIRDAWNIMLLDLPEQRIQLLKNLSKKHQIFLFSNTNDIHYKAFTSSLADQYGDPNLLDQLFIQTYFSHMVGERKPDAAAFNTVINDHQLNPSTTLFIDDSIQHIEGAKSIGIHAYHLQNEDIIDIFKNSNL
ncbi:HAD family phosphatase [Paracrocinitomix mangrovi]|uniref:HAD family hydrolase n=1 Tax=Paracrocinitomix mangrovi TaxID=2862509 RepID=UPI001C8E7C8B|nr:HAD family phosphatase [Paracrocinitomix mangrovi]UKN00086.1 HAD family phosphatase [Paracrocinitomix mangrovi]